MKKKTVQYALAAALLGGVFSAQAQLPVSRTTAIELTDLVTGFQFVPVPFTQEPLARGTVTAVSTDDLTVSVAAGTFTGLSGEFAAQIVTGADRGTTFEVDEAASTGTTVRLTGFNASGASVTANLDEVIVIKKQTLDTAFPSGGSFEDSSSPANADQLYVVNGSGSLIAAYYKTATGWLNAADDSAVGSTALPLNGSILVLGAGTPGDALVKGVMPSGKQVRGFSAGAFSFVGSPFGSSLTLGDLTASVTASSSPAGADQVYYTSGGSIVRAYRNSTGSEWRDADTETVLGDSTAIGKGFMIFGAASGEIAFTESFTE